ncbi:hypothetical protein AJ80_08449 [Polytolypa hystricis UAMH7299]|uniref:SUI1 domain-containing protein n=1 Tax=Polytolypa hystricis (strain UAMH7299) TaxID=1447883 RepID=A0A2B7X7P9_POLH7|nr:hypothetical protein AJ80_08449 [Polytolypa hystricis UAMH7299]
MFKKKPTIKTLASVRSSDRRKIADQIIRDYNISIPSPPVAAQAESENDPAASANTAAPSLASIRTALLPENTQSGRFTTTAGPELASVHGTVYVGSHPGEIERILWFKVEQGPGADGRIYPTVYTLWHNPRLVPLLHTFGPVMDKLQHGADLMTPGLANGPPFPSAAVKGALVAVASLEKPTVPSFVGICEIDVAGLGQVHGAKGHAVKGVQWEGDELWAWSHDGRPGQRSPDYIEGWAEDISGVEEGVGGLTLEGGKEQSASPEEEEEGGVSLETEAPEEGLQEEVIEPTTKEIDTGFHNAFLYAVYQLKRDNPSAPHYGLSLPVQPSYLVSNLITPYLPIYSPQHAQFYQIKKTSWKNVKKFIKHLDKEKLVKSKDRSGGETIIMDVDFDDARVTNFEPYKLPRKDKSASDSAQNAQGQVGGHGKDPSLGQSFTVKNLYRPGGKLTPTLFPPFSNADPKNYYSSSEVSKRLNDYLASQDPPIVSPSNPRIISLNPFISNTILSPGDVARLRQGTITRDALLRRLLEDPTLCAPFHAILKPNQTLEDVKLKAGPVPKVTMTIERRTRAKVVTRVFGLEVFGIPPVLLAEELQKKCAGSTSVTQATGMERGVMEVLVQGDHRRVVEAALVSRGVKTQWVDIVDKTKSKKTS